uniref:Uncharacterized protein n=1 Tax=Anguilla anguilla TaxID=7936 RepID=A0A0E9Q5X2_ANGAN
MCVRVSACVIGHTGPTLTTDVEFLVYCRRLFIRIRFSRGWV